MIHFYKNESPESDEGLRVISMFDRIIQNLIQYSYFDVDNDEVRVSIYPKELSVILELLLMNVPSNIEDIYSTLVEDGNVKFWVNK